MNIATTCPACHTRWNVGPELRGLRMRCPNVHCRQVFVVEETVPAAGASRAEPPMPAAPPPPLNRQVAGSVGELIPVLSAEQVEPGPPAEEPPAALIEQVPLLPAEAADELPPPQEVFSWAAPPPVRSPSASPPPQSRPDVRPPTEPSVPRLPEPGAGVPLAAAKEPFQELPGGPVVRDWGGGGPPPIRAAEAPPPQEASGPRASASLPSAARARRRSRWVMVLVPIVLVAGAVGAYFLIERGGKVNEAERYDKALGEFQARNYVDAAQHLRDLEREYPDSDRQPTYRFLAALSETLEPVTRLQADAEEARRNLDQLRDLGAHYQGQPLLKEHQGDLWRGLYNFAEQLATLAGQRHDEAFLKIARAALAETQKYQPPDTQNGPAKLAELQVVIANAQRDIARFERRETAVAQLQRLVKHGRGNVFVQGTDLIARTDPGLLEDSRVQDLLNQLPQTQRAQVKYVPASEALPAPPSEAADETSLLVVTRVAGDTDEAGAGGRVVPALVRGVLYALEPRSGRPRWARRVGVDATRLPLRLPATAIGPERFLVLAEDGGALMALDAASGRPLWRQTLMAPCPGRPTVVGAHAFVPTAAGRVEEIETTGGRRVGSYDLGEPLLGEAVHQPGTNLLYVPADSFTVYVLDVARRSCPAILYTEHPSGSLRGAPVVIAEAGPAAGPRGPTGRRGYLVLSQADTLESTRLRLFALPIREARQKALASAPRLPGWSWFPPWHNPEQLALVTDAGTFALYGLRQQGNRDRSLFRLGSATIHAAGRQPAAGAGALVAHADGDFFWVLARGGLRKWQAAFFRGTGPRLVPRWQEPLILGTALQAAQVQPGPDSGAVIFLTTQPAGGPSCLASAVEARSGTILWQQKLGLLCHRPPLVVGNKLVVRDEGGGLYLFEPGAKEAVSPGFFLGGRPLTPPGQARTLLLFRAPGGAVYSLAGSNRGQPAAFTLRRLALGDKVAGKEQAITLPAPFVGGPAAGPGCLVLPLSNGFLVRQPLAGGAAASGPNWRARQADDDAPGFVAWAGGPDYLVTDGSGKLRRFTWPEGGSWEEKAVTDLERRITAAPVVLARGEDGAGLRVCVADAADTLTLLEGPNLSVIRSWQLPGKITAGPFGRGGRVGCVLDHRRLLWIDPARKQPLWTYPAAADIVGEPSLVGDVLVVASLDGHFAGVDLATGKARGPGYTLRANVAPAAAPVRWQPGLLFAPLTDGTVLLLPEARLGGK